MADDEVDGVLVTLEIDGDGVEATDEAVAEEMVVADGPGTSVEDMVCIAGIEWIEKKRRKKKKSKECRRGVVVKETRGDDPADKRVSRSSVKRERRGR